MQNKLSKREQVAALLAQGGLLEAAMQARRYTALSNLCIVTFHRVAELGADEPYDPDVVDATPSQFRRAVETIARLATPIGMSTLLAALDGGPLPPNPVMITFDDGYRGCRDVVLPILRELGVPATFFIATGFADGRTLYWWEQVAAILWAARGRSATLRYPTELRIDASDPRARKRLDDIVKNTPGLDLSRFLAELRVELHVEWSAELEASLARPLIMTWDDIRALNDAGMDIQSHTCSHRVLETLDPDTLREELVGSRQDLERELGRPVRALAYPVGRRPPEYVRRAVAEAGYQAAFTNASGVNPLWQGGPRMAPAPDRFALRRLATERGMSDAMFLAQIAIPQLAVVRSERAKIPSIAARNAGASRFRQ